MEDDWEDEIANKSMATVLRGLLIEGYITEETFYYIFENYGILIKRRAWWRKIFSSSSEDYYFYFVKKVSRNSSNSPAKKAKPADETPKLVVLQGSKR